ncbi:MAG TPA: hypothetical protein VF189_01630 [Patescibacteria group bacterium]
MVDVEYVVDDLEPLWQKALFIGAVILLTLLIPSTAFGYFAEKSIPGDTLYPIKKGIEAGVLAIESLTPYGRTNYLLTLADNRSNETTTLIENAYANGGNFGNTLVYSDDTLAALVNSVKDAKNTVDTISDPQQKQQAEQNLANSIQKYQDNLQKISAVVSQPSTTFTGFGNSTSLSDTADTPTPTPSQNTSPTTQDQQELLTQLNQTQNDLQNLQDTLTTTPEPTSTPIPSPSPTQVPSPTIMLHPTNTQAPTPAWRSHDNGGDSNKHDKTH